jgi:hypothetical protein
MILNQEYIKKYITTDEGKRTPFRASHGATDTHLGDGLMIYSIIQHMRYKECLCIGSGGGYIPKIMTQARFELHSQGIFEGDPAYTWGDIGTTYVVDACNGVGGKCYISGVNSYFQKHFFPRFIKDTSENAFYNFFVLEDIKLDLIYLDGDHSYEGIKNDFELYSQILTENGMIIIHDTDEKYANSLIITEDAKKDFVPFDGPSKFVKELNDNPNWNVMNLFNFGVVPNKPSSTGITLITKKC